MSTGSGFPVPKGPSRSMNEKSSSVHSPSGTSASTLKTHGAAGHAESSSTTSSNILWKSGIASSRMLNPPASLCPPNSMRCSEQRSSASLTLTIARGSRRTLSDAVANGDEDRRQVVPLGEPRGADSHDPLMPRRRREHERPRLGAPQNDIGEIACLLGHPAVVNPAAVCSSPRSRAAIRDASPSSRVTRSSTTSRALPMRPGELSRGTSVKLTCRAVKPLSESPLSRAERPQARPLPFPQQLEPRRHDDPVLVAHCAAVPERAERDEIEMLPETEIEPHRLLEALEELEGDSRSGELLERDTARRGASD